MKASKSYLVLYEKSSTGYGAYAPDLPGCIAVGSTIDEVRQLMREGIAIYIDELQRSGEPVPSADHESAELIPVDMEVLRTLEVHPGLAKAS